jgi:hypothetical protein
MEALNKAILELIEGKLNSNTELFKEGVSKDQVLSEADLLANQIKTELNRKIKKEIEQGRKATSGFEQRNKERWAILFEALERLILVCTEVGNGFNNEFREEASNNSDIVFDLVVRLHARACHISREILSLLNSGYADGAHARWRALHEVSVTAMFISNHGEDCAERYYFYDTVESYRSMQTTKRYEARLQINGPSEYEIQQCKAEYELLIERFGREYGKSYGWASSSLGDVRANFSMIEEDVNLDHMRPYYKWASYQVHSSPRGVYQSLGMSEAKSEVLLVGQSNSGMNDPADAMGLSLSQITSCLLTLKPSLPNIVLMSLLRIYQTDIQEIIRDECNDNFL